MTHTSFPEQISKSTGMGRLQSYCTYMLSKVPSCAFSGFWALTLKLTQHFHLIYDIGKSDWNMHLEKFQVDKIQNGRPSAIIHLDRPDIAEYHENRSR